MLLPDLSKRLSITVVGLGYVGLPLALAFSEKFSVKGFDIDAKHIAALKRGLDRSGQVSADELSRSGLVLVDSISAANNSDVYIITVPTPVDENKNPDITKLLQATLAVSEVLKPGALVIYESTVYPGCTEEDCVPELERGSGLIYNKDFFCGYSPERVSPGNNKYSLRNIVKITSGSNADVAEFVDQLYAKIIDAGTYKAPSIKVAEAAKSIENAQRDVNISFINEVALICDKIGIDTTDVLDAASTKWNFLNFKPGLVGGHCIGVDPYYLAYKAKMLGHDPQVILSGREVNNHMSSFIVNKCIKLMTDRNIPIRGSNVLILGFTFKENCSDIRNSRVIDMFKELQEFHLNVDIFDPQANAEDVRKSFNIELIDSIQNASYELIILAVGHQEFHELDFKTLKGGDTVLFDCTSIINRQLVDARL